jgi:hypothetical protein
MIKTQVKTLTTKNVFSEKDKQILINLISNYKESKSFPASFGSAELKTEVKNNTVKVVSTNTLKGLDLKYFDKNTILNTLQKDFTTHFPDDEILEAHTKNITDIKNIVTRFFAEYPVLLQLVPLFYEAQVLSHKLDKFKLKGPVFNIENTQPSRLRIPNTPLDLLNLTKAGHTSILKCAKDQIDAYTDLFKGIDSPIDTYEFYVYWINEYLSKYEKQLSFAFQCIRQEI